MVGVDSDRRKFLRRGRSCRGGGSSADEPPGPPRLRAPLRPALSRRGRHEANRGSGATWRIPRLFLIQSQGPPGVLSTQRRRGLRCHGNGSRPGSPPVGAPRRLASLLERRAHTRGSHQRPETRLARAHQAPTPQRNQSPGPVPRVKKSLVSLKPTCLPF